MLIADTNVLSDAMRNPADQEIGEWLVRQQASEIYTTAVTKAEIYYGIEIFPQGKKRRTLQQAADAVFAGSLRDRVLTFDGEAAIHFAQIAAMKKARGRRMKEFDAQIAAIARARGATLATRNVRDFEGCGIRLINPWETK